MRRGAYYNELDPQKAAWLRELITQHLIAPGDVDERSVHDVRPDDLRGYRQCHFFAGIGIWSYALRLAGWEDSRECWTGSCPCPSFSAAGKGQGFDDPRHLWPVWMPLIGERRPPVVFGEQADAAIGHGWLDLVSTDMEASSYAVGAAVLGACSVGAPHRRQRLYFVAHSHGGVRRQGRPAGSDEAAGGRPHDRPSGRSAALLLEHPESLGRIGRSNNPDSGRGECSPGYRGADGVMGNADSTGREARGVIALRSRARPEQPTESGVPVLLADSDGRYESDGRIQRGGQHGLLTQDSGSRDGDRRPGPVNGFWRNADWIFCRDRRWRPVESFAQPVADGIADALGLVRIDGAQFAFPLAKEQKGRVGRLRGYGDGIVAQVAAAFIQSYMEARSETVHAL